MLKRIFCASKELETNLRVLGATSYILTDNLASAPVQLIGTFTYM